jgi:hypothetical protein
VPQLDPILIASRWTCGDIPPEKIAQIAIQLIEAGYEEPAVYRVAAEDNVSSREQVERLLQRMFSELDVEYPMPLEEAHRIVARHIASEVTAGLKDPWMAASQLDRVVPHWETEDRNVWQIYGIADEADWDSGEGRSIAILESELIAAFAELARS